MLAILVLSAQLSASRIEITMSGGLGTASFSALNLEIASINTALGSINRLVDGQVSALPELGIGAIFQIGERWCISDWLALGTKLEYLRTFSSTQGGYTDAEGSYSVDISHDCHNVGLLAAARVTLISTELVNVSTDINGGYFSCRFTRDFTLEVPLATDTQYSGLPEKGRSTYTGGAFGYEAGIHLAIPILDWLELGGSALYRSVIFPEMTDAAGDYLDTDIDGEKDLIDVEGFAFQLGFSLGVDLSL